VDPGRAAANRWFDRTNLDLKFRVVAGLGAETVQRNQELLTHICWQQYDAIVEANQRLARLGTARALVRRVTERHYRSLPADVTFQLAEPLHAFVTTAEGETLADAMRSRGAPTTYISLGFRRVAAKRPVRGEDSPRHIPPAAIPGEATYKPSDLLATLAAARAESVLNETGLSARLEKELGPLFRIRPFEAEQRPISVGVRVQTFESAQLAATVPDVLLDLPRQKAIFTIHGRTEQEEADVAPIFRAPDVPLPLADFLLDFAPSSLLADASSMPPETVGLFEENRTFLEAFMVGANHELNGELRWQEFPTDMRGTPLRRFWNRNRAPTDPRGDSIPPIHTWTAQLGANFPPGDADRSDNLVLVIRGAIVRKLGEMIVVINEATGNEWQSGQGTDHEPIFSGTVGSDIAYYGFDLSRQRILTQPARDRAFLVFYEPMGRMRFGLDVGTAQVRASRELYNQWALPFAVAALGGSYQQVRAPRGGSPQLTTALTEWDDLSWSHMTITPAGYVRFDRTIAIPGQPDYWGNDRHGGSLARSFWQRPLAAVMPLRRLL
jgi:hypothetical protein